MGPPTLLGRLHREFSKYTHVMTPLRKVRSQELSDVLGPTVHTVRLSNEMEVRLPGDSNAIKNRELPVNSCNSYLMALRILVYTMAEAGSFKVTLNDTELRFSSLEPLLTHLARAESYVLRYAANFPDSAILQQLRTIDESIRSRWAEHLRVKRAARHLGFRHLGF
eukprot:6492617-Amphidinium_carterae.1